MPKYQLYYFNTRGRGEPIRLVFAAAGIKYEDIRFSYKEWPTKKEELCPPFKQIPLLVIDGKTKIAQSMAIMKYIAREGGLCPPDSLDVAKCDMIVDADSDLVAKRVNWFQEKDKEKQEQLQNDLTTRHWPDYLQVMENFLVENNTGFLVGSKLSYADIVVFNSCDYLSSCEMEKFPKLREHYQRIREIPGIKTWLQERPDTPY